MSGRRYARSARTVRRARQGMVLPLVLIGMLLILTFSASLQQAAWRAMRGARSTWDAQRALYLADAELVASLGQWMPDSMASMPVGARAVLESTPVAGWQVRRAITRTAPLTAVVHAVAQHSWSTSLAPSDVPTGAVGDATRIRRTVMRVVQLAPPEIPVLGAVTVLGPVVLGPSRIDGRDLPQVYDPQRDDCGALRDSASTNAIAATQFNVAGVPTLFGATVTLTPAVRAQEGARVDDAFTQLRARSITVTPTALGTVPALPDWRAAVMPAAGGVTLEGDSRHVGLLAVDGDLTVHGALRVDGMLVVRGALRATAGTLDIHGALVVRDHSALGSSLGPGTRVVYAPCLAGRALAAVAVPRTTPFGVWNSP